MKTKITTLSLLLSLGLSAQSFQEQTIDLSSSYKNDVYYNLSTEEGESELGSNWNLAFGLSGANASIHFQSAWGNTLYKTTHSISDFSTVDTTGLYLLEPITNSPSDWNMGAFNQNPSNPGTGFDMGWGTYDIVTHFVNGSSVFIAKVDEDYYKIVIESLISGVYTFKYQNLASGSALVEETIDKSDYSDRNLIHYDMIESEVVVREPELEEWQFVIGKYIDLAPTPYPVVGVRVRAGMEVAKIENTDPNDVVLSGLTFSDEINTVGFNWKTFDMGTFSYLIEENLSYVLKDEDGSLFHFYFTDYEGSSTGIVKLMYRKTSVGVSDLVNDNQLNILVNPISLQESLTVVGGASFKKLSIYSVLGELISEKNNPSDNEQFYFENSGMYLMKGESTSGEVKTIKIVVNSL